MKNILIKLSIYFFIVSSFCSLFYRRANAEPNSSPQIISQSRNILGLTRQNIHSHTTIGDLFSMIGRNPQFANVNGCYIWAINGELLDACFSHNRLISVTYLNKRIAALFYRSKGNRARKIYELNTINF